MRRRFLDRNRFTAFLESLREFGALHGPVLNEQGVLSFAPLEDPGELKLEYTRTQIPPKKYFLPFREDILLYRNGRYRPSQSSPPETVLFGLHSCDLDGIAYLDRVFLSDRPDPCYGARRAAAALIGISCEPDDFCFCSAPYQSPACDLFLNRMEGGYDLSAYTEKGRRLAEAAHPLLEERDLPSPPGPAGEPMAPQDPQLRFSAHPLWEKFARTCVSCGACSVCCPTCYCFDVREYPSLSGGGSRLREWDNCLFVTHGEVAGGNFRPTRLDRLRYRFLHKFCGFTPLEGISSCVGCGRCKLVCPVDIDLRELLDQPRGGR